MSDSFPSKPSLSISMPEIKQFSAKFEYMYFTVDETIDEAVAYAYIDDVFLSRFGAPRKVILDFSPVESLATENTLGKLILDNHSEDIFGTIENPSKELHKLTSEVLLQSNGYVKITTDIHDVQTYVLSEIGAPTYQATDAIFALGSDTDQNGFIKQLLEDLPEQGTTYINPSTGEPTIESADSIPDAALQTLVAADFVHDVMDASAKDPFSIFSEEQEKTLNTLKGIQYKARQINDPVSVGAEDYFSYIDEINLPKIDTSLLRGLGIIGYIIFKTEITKSGERIIKNTLIVDSLTSTSIEDPYVAYGKTYEYNIHPLGVLRLYDDQSDPINILLLGNNYRQINLRCIEKIPPPAVQSLMFDYDGTDIHIKWSMPSQLNSLNGPIMDIKGYQIFSRNTIKEPFRLIAHLDFNDALQKYKHPEIIPEKYMKKFSRPVSRYKLRIKKDVSYIFGLCTIDAHGNSSNYSAQYNVRIDSRTNRLLVDFVAYTGSPKQYPNFTMPHNMFKDSMTVSGAKKATIFYKPAATNLKIYNTKEKVALISEQDADGINTPIYRLQMIDINTQTNKVLDIIVQKNNEENN